MSTLEYAAKFEQGLDYPSFLTKFGNDDQRRRWQAVHQQVQLSEPQKALLASFTREMKILCLAGAWCGDCVNQCPIFDHFVAANSKIQIRYFDRDTHPDLGAVVSICGGARVPAVLFLSEDFFPCGMYGDRTLSKYRRIVAEYSGPACSTGIISPNDDILGLVIQDWLDEFERIQLILRTSARLRQKHGD